MRNGVFRAWPYALDVLRIALLGPLEVTRDGEPVPVSAGKVSELLVRLALEAGAVVHADRLLDELWAAEAIATRRNTLQAKVKLLRRALGDPGLLATRDGGYALVVDSSVIDAHCVERDALAAAQLLDAGDDQGAAERSEGALRQYRGTPLSIAGLGEWAEPHRVRLNMTRADLLETHSAARLRLGQATELVGELEDAVAAYPFREPLWELLITALYRTGRQTDALAAYRRVKGRLADELGLDPGPGLQQLEAQILVQASALGAPGSSAAAAAAVPPGNLPSLSSELVGRDAVVTQLLDLIALERLVEIVGPGGVGKTAVALAVGRRLGDSATRPEGVWLARLDTAVTPDDVVDAVVAAFHVPGEEDALVERLRSKAEVLILDNCEHVVDAAGALAVRLLDAAPGLRILCTSQVPLDVPGEAVFDLPPLAMDAAAELFRRRAGAQRAAPPPGPGDAAVEELCRSLDGLPLAIELAAARTKTLSIAEIIRRLDHPFAVLSDPTSRRPERRRSLRSTIRWSYDLLFPDDQRGLWALATFSGGAPLAAVEFVLEALDVPAAAAIDVVGRLASRSLVSVDDEGGAVRYRLLDSIRAFALEAMDDAGCSREALEAHARWFARAAQGSTAGVRGSDQATHLAFARAERANIDSALGWCTASDPLLGLQIVTGFGWAWVVLGDSRGAQRILAALAAAGDLAPPSDRADALLLAAWIEASTDRLTFAQSHIAAAAALAEALDDDDRRARSAYYSAYVVSHHGEWSHALELTEHSRRLYDGLDRPWDQAANGLFAARAAISAGNPDRGAEALEQVQQWLGSVADPWLHVRCEAALGELARVQHRFADAVTHLSRAAETSRQLGFVQAEAYQVSSLGRALCQSGDYQSGSATLRLAVEKAEATGDVRLAALARVHLGRVLRAVGQDAAARQELESACAWHREAGGGEQAALGECLLAALDAVDHRAGAEERLVSLLRAARAKADAPVEVFCLDALARIAREAGDAARAGDLSAQADQRMTAASHFITERDRTDRDAGSAGGSPTGRP